MDSCELEKSTDLRKHLNFSMKNYFRNFDLLSKLSQNKTANSLIIMRISRASEVGSGFEPL